MSEFDSVRTITRFLFVLLYTKFSKSDEPLCGHFNYTNLQDNIVGVRATLEESPYVVALLEIDESTEIENYNKIIPGDLIPVCTATILSEHWCITTAHCLSETIQLLLVRYNSKYSLLGGQVTEVDKWYKHPEYITDTVQLADDIRYVTELQHDIGMVHTVDPMVVPTGLPMPTVAPMVDLSGVTSMTLYGFGVVSEKDDGYFKMKVSVNLLPCDQIEWYEQCVCSDSDAYFTPTGICGTFSSGGPVFMSDYIVAVNSLGPQICEVELEETLYLLTPLEPEMEFIDMVLASTDYEVEKHIVPVVSEIPDSILVSAVTQITYSLLTTVISITFVLIVNEFRL